MNRTSTAQQENAPYSMMGAVKGNLTQQSAAGNVQNNSSNSGISSNSSLSTPLSTPGRPVLARKDPNSHRTGLGSALKPAQPSLVGLRARQTTPAPILVPARPKPVTSSSSVGFL
jgi:hypothetical protein